LWYALFFTVIGCAPWDWVIRLYQPPGTDTGDPVIWQSAFCAAFAWLFGALAAVHSYRPGRVEPTPRLKYRRWLWTAGCALALLHIVLAMHAGHGWSHDAAYQHTAEVGGVGEGIYVNYLFAAVWLADVLWMWVAPNAYRHRPRWVRFAVHGLLAFIVFNATVVFATSPFARGVAILLSVALAWQLIEKVRGRNIRRERDQTACHASR
jgi:hypothetical protein